MSTYALVLTAAPGSGAITDAIVSDLSACLRPNDPHWLSAGDAWEAKVDLSDVARDDALVLAREAMGPLPIDVNLVAIDGRRKRLLAADMESTIIEQEMIDEMATLIGCHDEIAAITNAAMRGDLDFEASLVRRVALFAGLDVDRLIPLMDRVTLMPGAGILLSTMRAHGAVRALVSGGFTLFAEKIGARLGFDHVVANVLEIVDGQLTGRVKQPIVGPQSKADALLRLAREHSIAASETIAVGDGANDVAMLSAAGLGVAFRAKPLLRRHADTLPGGAVITHGDLSALLSLQGYACTQFVATADA